MPAGSNKSSGNMQFKINIKLGKNLADNVFQFKKVFQDDDTFMVRFFANQQQPEAKFCVLYIDGMIDVQTANRTILEPIIQCSLPKNFEGDIDTILNQVVSNNNAERAYDPEQMVAAILSGETVLLMDNCKDALTICTKGWKSRAIEEPQTEKVIRGPREGFVEPILVNLSLIRRRLATPNLKFKKLTLGVQSRTKIAVCYLDGIVNRQILDELMKRLNKINIDSITGSGYINELITDSPYSIFEAMGSTERPDVAVAKLLEGRIVIIADGTPVVITLPYLFEEHFQIDEDYYINFYYSTISRFLRVLSFVITVLAPAFYVGLMTYHQEMIPTPLLIGIYSARRGIPFPTIVETLGLILVYELLREGSVRMPIGLTQPLALLGTLVLGTAVVEARIVSASVIILVAITGLTGLMTPKIKGAAIILRIIFVILAGVLGLYGTILGIMGSLLHLCSIRSFGVPYMMSFTSLKPEDLRDTVVRAPLWFMTRRPKLISGPNKTYHKSGGNRL